MDQAHNLDLVVGQLTADHEFDVLAGGDAEPVTVANDLQGASPIR
jgi:hypothetical protein